MCCLSSINLEDHIVQNFFDEEGKFKQGEHWPELASTCKLRFHDSGAVELLMKSDFADKEPTFNEQITTFINTSFFGLKSGGDIGDWLIGKLPELLPTDNRGCC